MLLTIFHQIKDRRRPQGRMYELWAILFLAVLAILAGADSHRKIESFIRIHFKVLKELLHLKWRKPPAYGTIRFVIQGVDPVGLESACRAYAKSFATPDPAGFTRVGLDGKTVKGSFDRFKDQKAIQVFSAFLTVPQIILAHEDIPDRKTNEIPVAQRLIKELGLTGALFTADALHCQKKRLPQRKTRATTPLSK